MDSPKRAPTVFYALTGGAVLLALLFAGRDFLIPLAIAILLWVLLEALIEWFTRVSVGGHHIPRGIAIALGIVIVFFALAGVVEIIAAQVDAIAEAGPRYVKRIEELFSQLAAFVGRDVADLLSNYWSERNLAAALSGVVGWTGGFLVQVGLVVIYVVFLMLERAFLADKLAAMIPNDQNKQGVERILAMIASSIQRYIRVKTIISVGTGMASYIVLSLVGIDFASTWALLIFLFNYIPNIGSTIATVLPTLLALVQFDSLWQPLVILFGIGTIQVIIGNIIEPMFMRRSLNLSAFVIIVSLVLWGMIWGVIGMFLSVPITMMIFIICSHVPQWQPVAVALSKDGRIVDNENGGIGPGTPA